MIFLLLALLAAALATPGRAAVDAADDADLDRLFAGRRLALLVGPEAFEDRTLTPLRFADDDARALSEVLADRGDFDEVITLTSPADTRLARVRAAMAEISAASTSPDDTVFVYFSTHGTLARDEHGRLRQYVVFGDTRLADVPHTALPHEELLAWLDALPSKRKVLVLATCHSGQGKSALPRSMEEEFASTKGPPALPPLREVSEATVLIGVCAWNETAREAEGLGHDIYTWFFLEALDRADLDHDGAVTVTEAHDHARERTYAFTGGAQRPYAQAEILGQDPIVLTGHRTAEGEASLGSYRSRLDGYRVAVDGQVKGALPGMIPVEPGTRKVELLDPTDDRVIARQRVQLGGGNRLEVDSLLRRDLVRFGVGGGWQGLSAEGAGGPSLCAELHLPRWPGKRWELVGQGSTVARWPYPTVEGSLLVEHAIISGPVQLRAGGGLEGFFLGAPGDPPLVAPSLVPVPALSVAWLPMKPVFARLAVIGGPLWYTDGGAVHGGWTARGSLVMGGSL